MIRKYDCESYELEDVTLLYITVDDVLSFCIVPTKMKDKVEREKFTLKYITDKGFTHVRNEPMVQIALKNDIGPRDFSAGHSMKNSSSCYEFKPTNRNVAEKDGVTEIVTEFENGKGQKFFHHVIKKRGINAVECYNEILNESLVPITVEMISSFSLTGLSPFCTENPVDDILVHRLRSNWSAEGKLETFTAAQLQMEDSWSSFGIRQERIGQVGSMPCRKFMPFSAVEDRKNGCVWAVTAEAPISWQIDVTHHQGAISITGGIADYEFGSFRKTLNRGERFRTYKAYLTATSGSLESACANLLEAEESNLSLPDGEEELPIIFNDYCCTWGNPSLATLKPYIEECHRLGVSYFVTDVGWWRNDERSWYTFGDWEPGKALFPDGIKALADEVKRNGMKAGIWFEFEGVSCDSNVYSEHPEYLLKRDGCTIRHGERSLMDFRREDVRDYLYQRVIKLLKDNGFGYIKIDYNENIGIGVDGAESYGEGMRQHIECVIDFFRRIREEVPGVVIEVCSSGGMRLEPKFLSLGSMASFSDAHLGPEGAVIACGLHRFMPPRQMQIWVTLRHEYTFDRNMFTIAKGMLGRYCVSGEILSLDERSKRALEESVPFYKKIVPVIRDGRTEIIRENGITGLRDLKGSEYLVRLSRDGKTAVLYFFSFGNRESARFTVEEDVLAGYTVNDFFANASVEACGKSVIIDRKERDELFGAVILLSKK